VGMLLLPSAADKIHEFEAQTMPQSWMWVRPASQQANQITLLHSSQQHPSKDELLLASEEHQKEEGFCFV